MTTISAKTAYALGAVAVLAMYFGFRALCEIVLALGWYVA